MMVSGAQSVFCVFGSYPRRLFIIPFTNIEAPYIHADRIISQYYY